MWFLIATFRCPTIVVNRVTYVATWYFIQVRVAVYSGFSAVQDGAGDAVTNIVFALNRFSHFRMLQSKFKLKTDTKVLLVV